MKNDMSDDLIKAKNNHLATAHESSKDLSLKSLPSRVNLQTNNSCNLDCPLCVYRDEPSFEMSTELLNKVASELFPSAMEVLPSTRGEPMMFSRLDELIDLCDQNQSLISLYTNGTKTNKKRWEKIAAVASDIKFSIDSVDDIKSNILRPNASLKIIAGTISNLHNIFAEDFKGGRTITIQTTMCKSNKDEWTEILKKGKEWGADRMALSHCYFSPGGHIKESLLLHKRRSDIALRDWLNASRSIGMIPFYPRPFFSEADGMSVVFPYSTCHYLYHEVWIEPDGSVRPCFFPDSPCLGNIYDKTFDKIWNEKGYKSLRSGFVTGDFPYWRCGSCPIRSQFCTSGPEYSLDGFFIYRKKGADL